jgi:alpha-beta hydrolase superfamily lysophospholipase
VAFGKVVGRLAPNMVMANGLERSALSRDPQVVTAYGADPLVHDRVSARLGIGGIETGAWLLAHAAEFPQVPLLLVHGTDDRITSATATEEFASHLRGDVTLRLWPGLYHETHNEPEKTAVLCDNIAWLDAHLE